MYKITKQAEDIIRSHLERMAHQYKNQPGFAVTESISKRLLRPEVFTFTLNVLRDELQKSLADNQHHWQSQKFSDLCLLVSAVPALDNTKAKTYFQGKYLTFIEDQARVIGGEFGQTNIAHWVLCSNGNNLCTHLTIVPATQNGLFVFAQDMLTEKEKADLGLL